jgi:uncharacterized protein (DUF2141 family)
MFVNGKFNARQVSNLPTKQGSLFFRVFLSIAGFPAVKPSKIKKVTIH